MDRARQFSEEKITVPGGKQVYLNRYAFTSANQVLDFPAQGGAANCSKRALIYIDEAIQKQKLDAFITTFVHDEVVVECAAAIAKKVAGIVNECMVRAAQEIVPGVPFAADVVVGKSWADKK
jgi:DNA polymerase I